MKRNLAALIGLMIALAGCAADQAPPAARADHTLPPKIQLDVQAINLADRSGLQPASSPYNSNRFSPTISEAIKQWASDRLQATGQAGQAIIVVKDASLIAQPLAVNSGIDTLFTRQQGVKYIGRAEVSLEANGQPGFAMADAVATRSVTLPEDPSPVEKQDAYYSLLNSLMKDLGQNLESAIQTHMAPFILRTQSYNDGGYSGNNLNNVVSPVIVQAPPQQAQRQAASQYPLQPPALPIAPQIAPPNDAAAVSHMSVTTTAPVPVSDQIASANPTAIYPAATAQQAVYGTQAVATVPDLASIPGAFSPAPAPSRAVPPPIPATYDETNANAPQQPLTQQTAPQQTTRAAPAVIPLSGPVNGAAYNPAYGQ
jgi:hypothetical protein